ERERMGCPRCDASRDALHWVDGVWCCRGLSFRLRCQPPARAGCHRPSQHRRARNPAPARRTAARAESLAAAGIQAARPYGGRRSRAHHTQEQSRVTFIAAPEPKAPVTQGWLRVSQRKLDPQRSIEYLPYYPHDERQLLEPGEIYEVDLEIWPTGLAVPAGSRLTLTIQGKDFERPGATGPLRGVAWFTHDDPTDRPSEARIRFMRAVRINPIFCYQCYLRDRYRRLAFRC